MKKILMRTCALLSVSCLSYIPGLQPAVKASNDCTNCSGTKVTTANVQGKDNLLEELFKELKTPQAVWDKMLTYCYDSVGAVNAWIDAFLAIADTLLGYQDGSLSFVQPNGQNKVGEIKYNGTTVVSEITLTDYCNGDQKISGNPPRPVPIDGGASLLLAAGAAYGLKRLRSRKNTDA